MTSATMTVEALQELIKDETSFKKALRKVDREEGKASSNKVADLLKGQFKIGRTQYIHIVTLPDGSQISLKFYDTVRRLYNNKNVELVGKESYLSYLEVAVQPAGLKGYMYTTDVSQIVWGVSRTKAFAKHERAIAALVAQAESFGIDLSKAGAWNNKYNENF